MKPRFNIGDEVFYTGRWEGWQQIIKTKVLHWFINGSGPQANLHYTIRTDNYTIGHEDTEVFPKYLHATLEEALDHVGVILEERKADLAKLEALYVTAQADPSTVLKVLEVEVPE